MNIIEQNETRQGDYFIRVESDALVYCYNTMPVPDSQYFRDNPKEWHDKFDGDRPPSQEQLCSTQIDFEATLLEYNGDGDTYLNQLFGITEWDEAEVISQLGTKVILHKSNGY